MSKKFRQHVNKIKLAALGICFSLAVALLVVISTMENQSVTKVDAADYSGVSSGNQKTNRTTGTTGNTLKKIINGC